MSEPTKPTEGIKTGENYEPGHVQAATHYHGHTPHQTQAPFPFTPAEKAEFEKDDIFAGGAVVVLMSAIFCIGLILYTVIAYVTGTWAGTS